MENPHRFTRSNGVYPIVGIVITGIAPAASVAAMNASDELMLSALGGFAISSKKCAVIVQ